MLYICMALIDTEEDKKKFAVFYKEYRKLMFYIARQILKDEHLSEDAVQESFLRIAKNFHKVDKVLSPRTRAFAVIITRNVAFDMFKAEKKIIEIQSSIAQEAQELFSNHTFETVSYTALAGYMLELPEKYRDVLYLTILYGYTFNETASLLGVTVAAAKKRAQRARDMLKEKIKDGNEL